MFEHIEEPFLLKQEGLFLLELKIVYFVNGKRLITVIQLLDWRLPYENTHRSDCYHSGYTH